MSLAQELLEKASRKLDLPGDITAGLPRLALTGFTECSLDGGCAILEYEPNEIMKKQMRAREEAILAEIELPR